MIEAEWLTCQDPKAMLEFLRHRASTRKMRLFEVVCCRRIWYLLRDGRSRQAVEAAEAHAEGLISDMELMRAHRQAYLDNGMMDAAASAASLASQQASDRTEKSAIAVAFKAVEAVVSQSWGDEAEAAKTAELGDQAHALHDLFGNPFHHLPVDSRWLTPRVVGIARHIYEGRDFSCMPVLADALEEMGCTDGALLLHCREEGEHVRGCWVLDLLLEKS